MIQNFEDFCRELNTCGFSMGGGNAKDLVVERAIEMGCQMVQFVKGYMTKEKIELAHANGIRCNIFWSDDPEETRRYLEMGIDTILTNDYHLVAKAAEKYIANRRKK